MIDYTKFNISLTKPELEYLAIVMKSNYNLQSRFNTDKESLARNIYNKVANEIEELKAGIISLARK